MYGTTVVLDDFGKNLLIQDVTAIVQSGRRCNYADPDQTANTYMVLSDAGCGGRSVQGQSDVDLEKTDEEVDTIFIRDSNCLNPRQYVTVTYL